MLTGGFMNITESRDEAFEAIAEMLRSNTKKTKIASQLADYCVSDKTVYKWITKVEEMYDIEPIESILQQQKSELKSEIYQDLIRDYHKAKTDKDDELRRKIGAILNNTYLKKITFN